MYTGHFFYYLIKSHNIFHIFTFRSCRLFGCFSDGDHCHYRFCFRNGKDLSELVSGTKSHDQGSISKLLCLQDQILVLKSQIIAAPAVSEFIIWCSVFLKSGMVMYKGCNDQGGILCFCLVHFRQTFSADLLHHLFGHYTIISSGLGVFPAGCFLSGPDHCKKIFFCDPALRSVFTDGPSLFDQFLKFHIFPPYCPVPDLLPDPAVIPAWIFMFTLFMEPF